MPALLPLPVWATPAQLPAPAVETLGSAERAAAAPRAVALGNGGRVARGGRAAVDLSNGPPVVFATVVLVYGGGVARAGLGGDARVELIGGGGADLGNGGRQGGAALVGGGRLGGAVLGGGDHVLGEAGRCQQHNCPG